jgi:predicted nucleic acid-binding Zn ribbon protein
MATTLLARSTPYRPPLRKCERICTRCGITFKVSQPKRDPHLTECRDCR